MTDELVRVQEVLKVVLRSELYEWGVDDLSFYEIGFGQRNVKVKCMYTEHLKHFVNDATYSPVETSRKTGFARKNLDRADSSTILFRIFPGTRKCILSIRVTWGKKVTAFLNSLNVSYNLYNNNNLYNFFKF